MYILNLAYVYVICIKEVCWRLFFPELGNNEQRERQKSSRYRSFSIIRQTNQCKNTQTKWKITKIFCKCVHAMAQMTEYVISLNEVKKKKIIVKLENGIACIWSQAISIYTCAIITSEFGINSPMMKLVESKLKKRANLWNHWNHSEHWTHFDCRIRIIYRTSFLTLNVARVYCCCSLAGLSSVVFGIRK